MGQSFFHASVRGMVLIAVIALPTVTLSVVYGQAARGGSAAINFQVCRDCGQMPCTCHAEPEEHQDEPKDEVDRRMQDLVNVEVDRLFQELFFPEAVPLDDLIEYYESDTFIREGAAREGESAIQSLSEDEPRLSTSPRELLARHGVAYPKGSFLSDFASALRPTAAMPGPPAPDTPHGIGGMVGKLMQFRAPLMAFGEALHKRDVRQYEAYHAAAQNVRSQLQTGRAHYRMLYEKMSNTEDLQQRQAVMIEMRNTDAHIRRLEEDQWHIQSQLQRLNRRLDRYREGVLIIYEKMGT